MTDDPLDHDPGWPLSAKALLLFLIPGYVMRSSKEGDGLLRIRQIFVSFAGALVLFQLVLLPMGTTPGPENVALAVGVLAVGGIQVLVLLPIFERRAMLDCSEPGTLAGSYQTRFFL